MLAVSLQLKLLLVLGGMTYVWPHTSIIGLKHVSVFTTKLSSGNIWFIKSPNCLFHITAHIAIYLVFLISVTHKRLPLLNMHFPVNSSNREIPWRWYHDRQGISLLLEMRLYLIISPFTGKCMLSKGNRLCVTEIKKTR
jgi:hypothetical protein